MEESFKIKSFNCLSHPSESISRVSKTLDSTQTLFCVECILEMDPNDKANLIQLNKFLQELQALEHQSLKIGEKVPNSLQETMSSKEQVVEKYKTHLEQQKAKVNQQFESLLQNITTEVAKIQEKINYDLDSQLNLCKNEFDNFENKLYKHFGGNQDEERRRQRNKFSKENLASTLNSCATTLEFEAKVKELIREGTEGKSMKDENTILSELKEQSLFIQEIGQNLPEATCLDSKNQSKINSRIEEFIDSLGKFRELRHSLEPTSQIGELSKPIVKKIKELSNYSKRMQLELLYELDNEKPEDLVACVEQIQQFRKEGNDRARIIYAKSDDSSKLVYFKVVGKSGILQVGKNNEITVHDDSNSQAFAGGTADLQGGIQLSKGFILFSSKSEIYRQLIQACASVFLEKGDEFSLASPTGIMGVDVDKVQSSPNLIRESIHKIKKLQVYGDK